MASALEVEMLRRHLDELTAQMIEIRQQSFEHCDERSDDRTHGSRENNGTVGVETAPRGHESGSLSRTHPAKTLMTGILHSTGTRVHLILPIQLC